MILLCNPFYKIMKQIARIAIRFIRNNNTSNYKVFASVVR